MACIGQSDDDDEHVDGGPSGNRLQSLKMCRRNDPFFSVSLISGVKIRQKSTLNTIPREKGGQGDEQT